MNRLTITYGETTIFDGDNIEQFQWNETTEGVAVTAKFIAAAKPAAGGGLLDLLAAGRRQQTQTVIDQKRAELEAEKTDRREDNSA